MDFLNFVLPVLLYSLAIVLIIVLIVLGIKLILMLNKVDKVVDNVSDKVDSLNGIFSFIDRTTDSLALLSDTVVNAIAGVVFKLFKGKKSIKKKDEEDFEDE